MRCPSDTRPARSGPRRDTGGGQIMRSMARASLGLVLGLSLVVTGAACGKSGSSGTKKPTVAKGAGCAPVAGKGLVVLTDDKLLQTSDNVVPAVNANAGTPSLLAALNRVSALLDTPKLIALNKAVDIERKTPQVAAQELAAANKLTSGITKDSSGSV